ncbi:MAG TPA: GNAT family N-acetyltransferase [Gemmatimonadales bacterium]
MTGIPVLQTERLLLRDFQARDFGAYATMMADPEVTRYLARGAWGRGYAREGAAAALLYAREVLGRTAVISVIRPGNVASIGVATSLGAVPDGAVEFFGGQALIYRYPVETGVPAHPHS